MPDKYEEISGSIIIVSVIIMLLVFFISFILVLYYLRRKKSLREENRLKRQFSQTLLQSQVEIQEQTLHHIGQELHDNLGQIASLIKINLNTLDLANPETATEKVADTLDLTRQLIADIKALSVSLISDRVTQIGLAKAIETEATRISKTGQFTVCFKSHGLDPDFKNSDKQTILFRMAQEVLNNAVKHSKAQQINILLNATETLFILVLTDDGLGFDLSEKMNAGGSGLHNLQNRARLINATLSIQSTPGNGTKTTIEVPL